jgi:hypothetical protein
VERVAASGPDRVEVAGRWFGLHGRRLVRPTLRIRRSLHDAETRVLADLEHEPWAALEGEVWVAAFGVTVDLDQTADVRLSVAPDITVALRGADDRLARPGDLVTARHSARTKVADADPPRRPRATRERLSAAQDLTARLVDATHALERERQHRATSEQALESARATTRRLQTELGQARAALELALAAQAEAAAVAAELQATRRELHEAQRHHEELDRERTVALESPQSLPRSIISAPPRLAAAAPVRPLNPSLRHRTYWLGRLLALLVLAIVIAAIWTVLHSTILH